MRASRRHSWPPGVLLASLLLLEWRAAALNYQYSAYVCSSSDDNPDGELVFVQNAGLITGIDSDYTAAYVDPDTGTFYGEGLYNVGLFTNGQFVLGGAGSVGSRTDLIVRSGKVAKKSPPSVPNTDADLTRRIAGPFNTTKTGSLLKLIVCCSRNNFVESLRFVRELVGDTLLGNPICEGYAVEVPRPVDAPLWAGLEVSMGQPTGSKEWVASSIRIIWASEVPFFPPPPSPRPPSPRPPAQGGARAPAIFWPPDLEIDFAPPPSLRPPGPNVLDRLPPGTWQDWYTITKGVSSISFSGNARSITMLGKNFALVATPDTLDTVMAAGRYSKGTVLALGGESMLMGCCRALSLDSMTGMDRLMMNAAVWASYYGIKCGGARVRVSHAKYLPFARWLVALRDDVFLEDLAVQDTDLFIRSVRGTVPQGKRPPTDLWVLGPGPDDDSERYRYNETLAAAIKDYLNAGKGIIYVGPNPTWGNVMANSNANAQSVPAATPAPTPTPTPTPRPTPTPTPTPRATSTPTLTPTPTPTVKATTKPSTGPVVVVIAGGGKKKNKSPKPSKRPARGLLAVPAPSPSPSPAASDPLPDINQVSGPSGIAFAPDYVAPVDTTTLAVGPLPPSDLLNAEQAAGYYLQYLAGQTAKKYDIPLLVSVISKACAAMPRDSPGSSPLYTLVDAIASLGGTIPAYTAVAFPPPPPAQRRPPSPAPPSPYPSPAPPGPAFLGCYVDNAASRAFSSSPVVDRAQTPTSCINRGVAAGAKYIGLQGGNCYMGSDVTAITRYGLSASTADCTSVCPGDRTQFCGSSLASKLLLSVYQVA